MRSRHERREGLPWVRRTVLNSDWAVGPVDPPPSAIRELLHIVRLASQPVSKSQDISDWMAYSTVSSFCHLLSGVDAHQLFLRAQSDCNIMNSVIKLLAGKA